MQLVGFGITGWIKKNQITIINLGAFWDPKLKLWKLKVNYFRGLKILYISRKYKNLFELDDIVPK